jgi:DNA-binding NtrC family response regulator
MKTRGRIFAVDDDELIVAMLARALRKEGHEVHFQTSTADVLANIAAWRPDVVYLDIDIDEGMNGLDILAAIKKEGIATEVVMLSADDSAASVLRAMRLGAAKYCSKPFNIEEIKGITRNLLAKRGARPEE